MTASLQVKSDLAYVVLNWKQGSKRKQKWIKTDLPVKHGKRIGEAACKAALKEWEPKLCINYSDVRLGDYLKDWVERKRQSVEETTYREYRRMIEHTLAPYFDGEGITQQSCTVRDIERFYKYRMDVDGVSANTISHHQACLYSAFKDACRLELLNTNPASKVSLPKVQKFRGTYCTPEEAEFLLNVSKGTWLEIPIYMAIWFGLRRGEIAGLRWSDVDFNSKLLTITGVLSYVSGGKPKLQYRDHTKSDAGMRSFPLSDTHIQVFKHWHAIQAENRLRGGGDYSRTWEDFVCVNELGGLIASNYISWKFPKFIEQHGMRKIRFHDLRHTNAVLLLSNGASMQEVKDWLGHESYSTTDEYYGGVLTETKKEQPASWNR